jgi:hypothetical protein
VTILYCFMGSFRLLLLPMDTSRFRHLPIGTDRYRCLATATVWRCRVETEDQPRPLVYGTPSCSVFGHSGGDREGALPQRYYQG